MARNARIGVRGTRVRSRAGTVLAEFCRISRIVLGCAQRTTLALDVGHGLALVVARPTYKR